VISQFSVNRVEKESFVSQHLSNCLDTPTWPSHIVCNEKGQYYLSSDMDFQIVGSKLVNEANYVFIYDVHTFQLFILGQYVTSSTFIFHVETRTYSLLHSGFNHFNEALLEPLESVASYLQENLEDLQSVELDVCLEIGSFSIHHYFYDSLPGLMANSSLIKNKEHNVLTISNSNEFLDTSELFGFIEKSDNLNGIERCTSKRYPGFYLRTGYPYGRLKKEIQMKLDEDILIYANNQSINSLIGSPRIWVDLSMLNRKWNLEETLSRLLSAVKKDFSNAHFIFDDLTSAFDREYPTRSRPNLPKWLEVILEENNITNYTNLSFAQASEKITYAQMSDFFFASYSTGSMFPSRFARLPGIALSSPVTYAFEQDRNIFQHERINTIPIEYFTFEDQTAISPWIDFALDVDKFVGWAIALLKENLHKASLK
jgi:hypothetical protein